MKLKVTRISALTGHKGSVYALCNGLTPETFFSGSSDKLAVLWNLNSLQPDDFVVALPAIVYALCYIPEKNLLLAGTATGAIHIIDTVSRKEIKTLQLHSSAVFDIQYSVLTDSFYTAGADGNFVIGSLSSLSATVIKKLCNEKVRSISINYTTSEIAVASADCLIRIFELHTLAPKHEFAAHTLSANAVCYSPDGMRLLSGGRDAFLNCWDAKTYELIKSIPAHNFAIYDIVFSPDHTLFATASRDKTIKIWDANTCHLLFRISKENFEGHLNSVNKLIWSQYNNYLISTGDDRAIMIWDVQPCDE